MKRRKIIRITKNRAEIEVPSLKEMFRIPIEIFNKFAGKKVRIRIKVVK